MLLIRREQIQALKDNSLSLFITQMVLHLKQNFPNELAKIGIKQIDLEPLVRESISQARGYGIEFRNDLCRYIELVPLFGPRFDTGDTTAWIGKILNDPVLDGHEKMDAIFGHCSL